ncbi:MAG: metal-dependent transcriptional regulator [Eubacteriales bacterium]|nr:metal-dependent transcriptional regulator [Eubacteriales bacterium]
MYESGENYLETILILKNEQGVVRSIDIAKRLNFSKPSVSRAMYLLKEEGYIEFVDGKDIELTEKGREEAERIYERHRVLTMFLQQQTGLGANLCEPDACRIEHVISQEVFDAIRSVTKMA